MAVQMRDAEKTLFRRWQFGASLLVQAGMEGRTGVQSRDAEILLGALMSARLALEFLFPPNRGCAGRVPGHVWNLRSVFDCAIPSWQG